ncbi:MAG TPA: MEDS domain-containing protein [Rhizomicrobium sp.]|nr:MEDS domain-containing protein [Rhizomicrobium sp.]
MAVDGIGRRDEKPEAHRRPIALSWDETTRERSLRDSGISLVGRVPWGSHLCVFCETEQDLVDSAIAYFRPAPASNERCMWIVYEPPHETEALKAVHRVPEIEAWWKIGGIEILRFPPGYAGHGQLDVAQITAAFHSRAAEALAKGYDGVRVCVNAHWRKFRLWADINAYERMLDGALLGQRAIALCAYKIEKSSPQDVLDVARTHQCVIARRMGNWEFLKTDRTEKSRKELEILNQDLDRLPARLRSESQLTERELVVLAQIIKGASSKEVARTLGISPRTVEFHRAGAMQKLGAKNVAELVRIVLRGR